MLIYVMYYFSTRDKSKKSSFAEAALTGLAPDGGLFVPEEIPQYSAQIRSSLGTMAFTDIAFETIKLYVQNEIPDSMLSDIVHSAFTFTAPLVPVAGRYALELFHGPTAAFKDFGARFMARAFSFLRRGEDRPLRILVATSGDTGGAVADGFFDVPGIFVTVLYPKDRVSPLQERQIAGLGKNITALAVEGSFDDCQRLVKAALADESLKKRMSLSSANSINISRLIPQAVYYSAAAGRAFAGLVDPDGEATPRTAGGSKAHAAKSGLPVTLCVPSGNFGNLTAGLYAMKMGAPVRQFIAATNINKTVPDYLDSGEYLARISQATISNAMDVGAPSNFERMSAHFSLDEMRRIILGVSVSDDETRETIARVHEQAGYFLDPHSAVGWKGVDKLYANNKIQEGAAGILCTAHPAKFSETVEPLTGAPPIPAVLSRAMERTVNSKTIPAEVSALTDFLSAVS
jgi:threonine synthase